MECYWAVHSDGSLSRCACFVPLNIRLEIRVCVDMVVDVVEAIVCCMGWVCVRLGCWFGIG